MSGNCFNINHKKCKFLYDEHTIKSFEKLRRILEHEIEDKGIHDYIMLLSICETCRYKGVNFLDFLRSGEKDIDDFIGRITV